MSGPSFIHDLPEQLYLASQVRELDRIAIQDYGIPGFELMQKAARFAFHQLIKTWPDTKQISVFCGAGNNAGDGYLLASIAAKQGIQTQIISLTDGSNLTGDAKRAFDVCINDGLTIQSYVEHLQLTQESDNGDHIIVDALLGTGLARDVSGGFLSAIESINASGKPVLAVDIPSGLCANTGQPKPIAVKADVTATFIGNKLGLMTAKGRDYAGSIRFSSLNVPSETYTQFEPELRCPTLEGALATLPSPMASAHKGSHGRALLMGGNIGFGGAIILASRACARMGAGLTSCFTHKEHRSALLQSQPEVMTHCEESALPELINNASAIAVGPGLGKDDWAQNLLQLALESSAFLVLDADALNLLALDNRLREKLPTRHVLTPHPGEAARLLDCEIKDIENDRLNSVRELSKKYGGTVILKGSGSLISNTSARFTSLCRYGNPGMASGGMGDVLTGIITGLISRYQSQTDPNEIIELAALLHAYAADCEALEKGPAGLLASDLIDRARLILNGKTTYEKNSY